MESMICTLEEPPMRDSILAEMHEMFTHSIH
jgi:hypothetical protein